MLGDCELLRDVIESYLVAYRKQFEAVEDAIQNKNSLELARAAHLLKASIGALAAGDLFDTAFALEQMGKEQRMADAPSTVRALGVSLREFDHELKAYLQTL